MYAASRPSKHMRTCGMVLQHLSLCDNTRDRGMTADLFGMLINVWSGKLGYGKACIVRRITFLSY